MTNEVMSEGKCMHHPCPIVETRKCDGRNKQTIDGRDPKLSQDRMSAVGVNCC